MYSDCNCMRKNTRSENLNNLISAYLNINTIGNKFDFPAEQVQGKSRHFDNFKN